ncbi:MFS transporter [Clavibacter michiganensis subsp. michiganensis]|uniref:Multidrug efflux protein YfmO n=1 Tax=Clavibacter michiganensis subsp. michiganensis TaxID=33013 RepID=A0A251XEM4_CLAMM|nr:MFS transporter [Clavibacter michiganensis]MBW8025529.1 MFS transporter [Clavibacter michiganensis subsp. michiganensis]MDO4075356.1 MFS transporter [Clavibacter michiganensis]MDO4131201.1 MFS transporter [Clavibacter michiganensis]MDO4137671.1 MFS transporter [Clavibacter michiganensis]MWJ13069.1 MFS transporter [Clavibacter michiganensis subsp. michiganensis]
MSTQPHASFRDIFRQPRSVFAVAFACVIAFMGIGLVDPILPAIASSLDATATEAELLFTSYLLVTGLAMLVTSWISSRIGAKRTLLIGLAIIVVFAAAAGLSQDVEQVIGFRAGWGLGNALFISTALATIVGSASGGTASAIMLYEAALGLGIAVGPLLGGLLGSWSWRGPFFGTATLMAVGFVAILALLRKDDAPRAPMRLSAPLRALRTPALAVLAAAALFYNIGFFVLLAYTPFPLGFDAIGLGLTFFGWGVGLAITSVLVAPLLTRRMARTSVLRLVLPLLAADLAAAGLVVRSSVGLVVCVIVGGLLLGVLNTVLTECVMEATDHPRSVASSAYSSVRFLGGAIAPPAATELANLFSDATPYYAAAGSVLVALVIVVAGHRWLRRVDEAPVDALEEAQAVTAGDA